MLGSLPTAAMSVGSARGWPTRSCPPGWRRRRAAGGTSAGGYASPRSARVASGRALARIGQAGCRPARVGDDADPRPAGSGCVDSKRRHVEEFLHVFVRITPACSNRASTATFATRQCRRVARGRARARRRATDFTATIGLSRPTSGATRPNRRGFPKLSRYSTITRVRGSSASSRAGRCSTRRPCAHDTKLEMPMLYARRSRGWRARAHRSATTCRCYRPAARRRRMSVERHRRVCVNTPCSSARPTRCRAAGRSRKRSWATRPRSTSRRSPPR